MAYNTKYRGSYGSIDTWGTIYIKEEDWAGDITTVTIARDGPHVEYQFNGWEDPIIGLIASFSIANDQPDFFTLMELLTAEERQFQVEIVEQSPNNYTMFEGFLVCENNEQVYLEKHPISLVASSYLSKLQYVNVPGIEDLETDSFINIIAECLAQAGSTDNILVNCHLYATGDTLGTQKTLFNCNGVYKEIFWKNNIDRDNGLEIMRKILTTFDCYIYWYDGYWRIERYADIWTNPQVYVEYDVNTSYEPGDTGAPYQEVVGISDFANYTKRDAGQTIGVIQGLKEVEVKVHQQYYLNLIKNDFGDENIVAANIDEPYPNYGLWAYYSTGGHYDLGLGLDLNGKTYKGISNSIYRANHWGMSELYRGLYSTFRATVSPDTTFTIKFKFATSGGSWLALPSNWDGDWSRWKFNFHWQLYQPQTGFYIILGESSGLWSVRAGDGIDDFNEISVQGSEFDEANGMTEVTITIPIGELGDVMDSSGGTSDEDFVFGLLTETVEDNTEVISEDICEVAWYGDVVITASGDLTDNHFKGTINTNFLNKKTIDLYFSDIDNLNIKNGIFRGDDLNVRTETWEDGEETLPLAQHKIRDKFRLYNQSRQKLSAKFHMGGLRMFKPFRRLTDSSQSNSAQSEKSFVIAGGRFNLSEDSFEADIYEYDNQETITIA